FSSRRQACCESGIRISRLEPIATSKRVTNAAPLRQRFSLEVSSVKTMPRASRPVTCMGRRTAILRSARCLESWVLVCMFSRLLHLRNFLRVSPRGRLALEKSFHCIEHFAGGPCHVNGASKFAAVADSVRKPASELLHFAYGIGLVGGLNL